MKNTLTKLVLCAAFGLVGSARVLADFGTISGWDRQLFPSFVIATSNAKVDFDPDENTLGDANGLLGVRVTATKDGQPIRVTISCDDFMETSEFSGKLSQKDSEYFVYPSIKYRYEKLSKCRQATPASITYRVQLGDGPIEETVEKVIVRPIDDCPLAIEENGEVVNLQFTFAAYVNEQHPYVDKLLREALDIGVVDRFTGYQDRDPKAVLRQVYSLWNLMASRDTRYSSITTTAAGSNTVFSQHVRLIEDTVNNSQANCVDGSVLLVSMLRKIGIESFLILEPGHCYMGFYLDEAKQIPMALETTLVDNTELELDAIPEVIVESVPSDFHEETSYQSFVAALLSATDKLENILKHSGEEEADSADPTFAELASATTIIDIELARKNGVVPIPFNGKDEFVAYDHFVSVSDEDESESDEESEMDEDDDSE